MSKIIATITNDLLRNRALLLYVASLLLTTTFLLYVQPDASKSLVLILKVMLLILPGYSMIFSIIYFFNSADFILLLMAQPIRRTHIVLSFVVALSIVFVLASWIGLGVPMLITGASAAKILVLCGATFLSMIFVGLGLLVGVSTKEKSHSMGFAMILWFYFVIFFDGLILLILFTFSDYPMEKIAIGMTFLNPIELVRVMVIMHTDRAALMGYSGAVFREYFTAVNGLVTTLILLSLWVAGPAIVLLRRFEKKNF